MLVVSRLTCRRIPAVKIYQAACTRMPAAHEIHRKRIIPFNASASCWFENSCCIGIQIRLFHFSPPLSGASDSAKSPDSATIHQTENISQNTAVKPSQRQRLKQAVRDYGATVIVFHTCISLFTLGVSYAAVSSGLDVIGLLSKIGVGQSVLESKLATGASTFVIAYAVHKVFVPARMATTLAVTPFIVRYLRRVGILKPPTTKP